MGLADLALATMVGVFLGGLCITGATTVALRTSPDTAPAHRRWRRTGVRTAVVGLLASVVLAMLGAVWPYPIKLSLMWAAAMALSAMTAALVLLFPWTRDWGRAEDSNHRLRLPR